MGGRKEKRLKKGGRLSKRVERRERIKVETKCLKGRRREEENIGQR